MKRMWVWSLFLMIGAAVLIGVWRNEVAAQQPAAIGLPIGVVDMVKVFNDSEQWKAINDSLKAKSRQADQEAEKRKEEIAAKTKELDAYKVNTPEWTKCGEEVLRLRTSAEVWAATEKARVEQLKAYWVQKNYDDVNKAVKEIARQRGLSLVLMREDLDKDTQDSSRMFAQIINRKVVYCDERMEVTADVLKKLNDEFKLRGGAESLKTQ